MYRPPLLDPHIKPGFIDPPTGSISWVFYFFYWALQHRSEISPTKSHLINVTRTACPVVVLDVTQIIRKLRLFALRLATVERI